MIRYHRVKNDEDLEDILALQKRNLGINLSDDEKLHEGFVTLQHDFEILKKMNDACPHFVAKKEGKIIGFALSMLKEFKDEIPLLIPIFKEIDTEIRNQNINDNYIAMGQVCIAKEARGKGVFRGLYTTMQSEFKNKFDSIITEVDTKNLRSSNAHKSMGFKLLKNYTSNHQLWEIIILKV
ncbi:acetyltransferase (GNAT) family protein [Lutibacter sp. Hel_I_33_5]|uniref:GNAT family N-acetyltransferase n=1 Tax=Lutibacter sp. Hel_I_33_5 TaxID=1566289 RepID=UPI0011A5108B|nr:GNAT family N-acetyltransferase [Lutibacter sp. Hel_I_33_5]TVZ56560.1 acetyltransferase (GNAT) family protein [Lutibacter sp. Hel_I_33_5]